MRLRQFLALPTLCLALWAQDPVLKDSFIQAKALWAQNDRDGATSRFESIIAPLASRAASLDSEWLQLLCESYNALAVLDDRSSQNKARAQSRLQALVDLNPDFELDRVVTSQKLAALFERLKGERFATVRMTYSPEGGQLTIDGNPVPATPRKHLPFGAHTFAYSRPGHTPEEISIELAPRDAKTLEFRLTRTSSTITLHVKPSGTEVFLDGLRVGRTSGQATDPDAASKGLRSEELSAPFVIPFLEPGKHLLELRQPCYRTKQILIPEDWATPPADHTHEPILLVPSDGVLTVTSPWPEGVLFLDGRRLDSLPIKERSICAGAYELLVRFPGGSFSQRIQVEDGRATSVEARPRPRIAFLGLEGGEFTGRQQFIQLLQSFGERLESLAFVQPQPGESPSEALSRLKKTREAELVLMATPVPDRGMIHCVELRVATLDDEEERLTVKVLEQDPLAGLAERLNRVPPTQEPGLGLTLLDLPGESGPWVLSATQEAVRAGITLGRTVSQAQGLATPNRQTLQKIMDSAKEQVSLVQDGQTLTLPIQWEGREIPLGHPNLCYPSLLAHLRLQLAAAKGEQGHLLRLNQALALMQMKKYASAVLQLRDTRFTTTRGVSQGTVYYHVGQCYLHMGTTYQIEARKAFEEALKYPQSTLLGPDGPLVAPLAKQALEDLY